MALDGYSRATLFKGEMPIFFAGIVLIAYFDEIFRFKSGKRRAIKILNGLIAIFFLGTGLLLIIIGASILNHDFFDCGLLPLVSLGVVVAIILRIVVIKYRKI